MLQTYIKLFDDILAVKIFEVGNKEAIDYSNSDDDFFYLGGGNQVQDESTSIIFYLAILLILILLLTYLTSNHTRAYIVVSAAIVYMIAVWLSFFDISNSVEYHHMLSGTSIWPAITIRMLAAILAAFFIYFTLSGLRINTNKIIDNMVMI